MARNIFYDPVLQQQFDREGYVLLDLLNNGQAKSFLALYDELEGGKGTANTNKNTYELSFFEKDIELKKTKFNRVYSFIKPHLDKVLVHYTPIMVNLFNKQEGTGEVPMHQNWTFVDERQFTSVSVWCPMQDVSRDNGTLEVVPRSHKVICDYRGPTIPWVFDNLNDVMKAKYMVPFNLKFGQIAILDDSIIHFSGINTAATERKAIQLILKPEEVKTVHCFKGDAPDEINIVDVPEDYFFDFDMWQKPGGGTNLRTVVYPIVKLTESDLLEKTGLNHMAGKDA